MTITSIIFDKDGTLVDMDATWGQAMTHSLNELCNDDEQKRLVAHNLGLDMETMSFTEDSIAPRTTWSNLRSILATAIDPDEFAVLNRKHAVEFLSPTPNAVETITQLFNDGYKLGLATNHVTEPTVKQLELLGIDQYFTCVLAADSGFGSKPEPGMLTEAMSRLGADTQECVMVGDTTSDLGAAKAAGLTYFQLGHLAMNDTVFEPDYQLQTVDELVDLLKDL